MNINDYTSITHLNILDDGPFRHVHSAATGELILTLYKIGNKFVDFDNDRSIPTTLRHWKAVARRRIGGALTDTDNRN